MAQTTDPSPDWGDLGKLNVELKRTRAYDAAFDRLIKELNPQLKRPYLVKLIVDEAGQERYEAAYGGLR